MTLTPLAAYLLLFLAFGIGFIFLHLMAGKLIRPNKPDAAKGTVYECGEPTIGTSWIQFDLRFYVVALLFVIFDVEVAFFFPWAVVFGKANTLAAVGEPTSAERYHKIAEDAWPLIPPAAQNDAAKGNRNQLRDVQPEDVERLRELQAKERKQLTEEEFETKATLEKRQQVAARTVAQGRSLSWLALLEIAVFFGVLLVGFAYLWRRGDLAWVRSLAAEEPSAEMPSPPPLPQARTAPQAQTVAHA
jgi:NADH-quinone oxidoreductase subunit A